LTNGLLHRPSSLKAVADILAQSGVDAYIVGGYLRDALLGRKGADIDFAVAGDAGNTARMVADRIGGRYVVLDEANRVYRVAVAEGDRALCFDFSAFDGDINSDLARRDFTVDAMAVRVGDWAGEGFSEKAIDPFGGMRDISAGRLRTVADSVFRDDPARLLRAVRLAGELGLTMTPETEALVRRDVDMVSNVAGERVRDELVKVLSLYQASRLVSRMNELGLLVAVFPELGPAKGFEQNGVHYWDVLDHSLNTVAAAEFLVRQGEWEFASQDVLSSVPWSEESVAHFGSRVGKASTRAVMLKIAALFHDVAKPQTKLVQEDGRWHFFGHASLGAGIIKSVLERTRFSRREVEMVETEVTHHLRPWQLTQGEIPTRRAVYRYFRDTGDTGIDIFFLSLADYLATHGPRVSLEDWQRQVRLMEHVFAERMRQRDESTPIRIIDGHDMMLSLGLKPGPVLGRILAVVDEARATGEINTREEALAFARKHLERSGESEET